MLEVAHRDNILTVGHKVGVQHPATSEMIKEGFLVHLLEQYFLNTRWVETSAEKYQNQFKW